MEYKKFGDTYVLRLDQGEEVMESLRRFAEAEQISLASVQGIGALSAFDLKAHHYEGCYEITSLLGTIDTMDGQFYCHLHLNAAEQDDRSVGGHLTRAVIRVTGELIAHHFVNKTQYKDYAILYRGNHQSRVFEKFLMQNRIPYKISGGTSFFSRPEIKDLLAYLRVLTNPDDDSAFLRIVNTPKREIGPATLKKLGEWAMTRNKSMFTASFDMGLSQTLSGRGYEALTRFTHWLAEIQRLAEREPIAAVRDLIHGMDYESWLYETSPSPKAAEMRMKNVNQLFSWMTEMLEGSELDEPMTLTQVVTRFTLRDMMERGESEEELDQVQLMTLHASKGLEFPYVYMVGMEEGFLPHQSSIDEDNIDEERRLAYVGITRAQKELTFTLCKERRQYGELVRPEPSRFLLELPQDDLIWEQERKVVSAEERMQKGQSHLANLKAMMAAKRGK